LLQAVIDDRTCKDENMLAAEKKKKGGTAEGGSERLKCLYMMPIITLA